jgi:1,2-phenylacetyl-CoA epoxidase PaaB subunit
MLKKRKRRLVSWEAIRIIASPARMYGVVHASDEEAALAKAMRNFR